MDSPSTTSCSETFRLDPPLSFTSRLLFATKLLSGLFEQASLSCRRTVGSVCPIARDSWQDIEVRTTVAGTIFLNRALVD
jgi:hypothetical protein